ncbi:phage minor capsid protein [Oceanobacillus caeni]|uniref:phage minor capsid protein n=1 Tax=Oceanobacillus caeni TaxID=405946 RepID=UPI002149CF16|nr:phage minor capsid protein [Oceanobacillus caeni]MCR1833141.1 phage minor capsid protein [Oceanobacillus caeni]
MNLNGLDKSAGNLVKEYQRVYLYILDTLKYQINNGLSENQARSLLREIQLELKRLDEEAYKWSYDVLPQYYYSALSNVDASIAMLSSVNVIGGSPIVMHKQAIEVATNSLYTDLAKNTQYMSEQAKQIIRENGRELINRQVISGESQKRTKKDLKDALVKNGVTSFVDAGKKQWSIDNYSSMAIRTKSRLIHNQGTMNRLSEYRERYPENSNFDLIQISKHSSKCWCGYYEGTVWSISGKHPFYPSVERLPNYPYQSFHPNCKHVYLPYIEDLRGKGEIVNSQYLNRTIKDLNKEHYHKNK